MKKDIEWLKNEILTDMQKLEDTREIQQVDMKYQTLRKVAQKINQLDEPEVLSEDWIGKNVEYAYFDMLDGSGRLSSATAIIKPKKLKNLLVPEQELPVIPNYVAEWISVHHERFDLYPALKRLESNALSWEDVYEWYRRNTHTFVNAYLTGKYEVEEGSKYIIDTDDIEISDGNHYLTNLTLSKDSVELPIVGDKFDAIQFDDINQAQAIASYLGGRVEELEE